MTPLYYSELVLQIADPEEAAAANSSSLMNQAYGVIHGAIRVRGLSIGVALPDMKSGPKPTPGQRFRLFAQSAEVLREMLNSIAEHPGIAQFFAITRMQEVPSTYDGPWESYRRFRVPTRSSRTQDVRARRLDEARSQPHFKLGSRSTGQAFILHVQREAANEAHQPFGTGPALPDSYGLASKERLFSVPALKAA
jgi:CRISPR-associated endoribonuclease Cas6/Csy4 subtype I-F